MTDRSHSESPQSLSEPPHRAEVNPDDPFASLARARISLRSDLHISRQIQEGQPIYVVHDPVGFRTHRLTQQDYAVVSALSEDAPLGAVFDQLVDDGTLEAAGREDFYSFVAQLHRLSFLATAQQNGEKYYEQYVTTNARRSRRRWLRLLFLRIPLANPDAFLSRLVPVMRVFFTRSFGLAWLSVVLVTLGFVVSQGRAFLEPLHNMLALRNLPFLWAAFVVLKIWHELGHGFACKAFGGRVPEMGFLLLAGNPAAYVDATAAWSFEKRRHRIVVMLGGMYFESLVAVAAVYVWAFSANSTIASCAHYVATLSTITTVLFNANPLMRYDGYFILSELLGIQNLRPRSVARVRALLKRVFLGLPDEARDQIPAGLRRLLMTYGVASSIYKTTLVLTISLALSYRFPFVGLLLATYFLITSVGGNAFRLGRYLLTHEEVQPVRFRARCVFTGVFVGMPALLLIVPVPFGIRADGLLGAETEHHLYADSSGELQDVFVEAGQPVGAGETLLTLDDSATRVDAEVAAARLRQTRMEWELHNSSDIVKAVRLESTIETLQRRLWEAKRSIAGLSIASPEAGTVAKVLSRDESGRRVTRGEPAAVVVRGGAMIRTWLTEEQLDRIQQQDKSISFRTAFEPSRTQSGRILHVRPVKDDLLDELALTQLGGGTLMVNPETGVPLKPLFEVEIAPQSAVPQSGRFYGSRVSIRFEREYESVGLWAFRRCLKFVQRTLLS